jgi:hypothetical protein
VDAGRTTYSRIHGATHRLVELSIMGVTRVGIRDAYYAAIRAYRRLSRVYAVFSRTAF